MATARALSHRRLATYKCRGDLPQRIITERLDMRRDLRALCGKPRYGWHRNVLEIHHQRIGEELGCPVGKLEHRVTTPDGCGASNSATHDLVAVADPLPPL